MNTKTRTHRRKRVRRTAAAACIVGGGLFAAVHEAEAHQPNVYANCDGVHVDFQQYEGDATNNKLTIVYDGVLTSVSFAGSYTHVFVWPAPRVIHSFTYSLDANRNSGNPTQWDIPTTGGAIADCTGPVVEITTTTTTTGVPTSTSTSTSTTTTTPATTTVSPSSSTTSSTVVSTTSAPSTSSPATSSTSTSPPTTSTHPPTSTSSSTTTPATSSTSSTSTSVPTPPQSTTASTLAPSSTSSSTSSTTTTARPATTTTTIPKVGPLPTTGSDITNQLVVATIVTAAGSAFLFIRLASRLAHRR